jgi:glycosyltransferase involved in cell wall biosynthesis
MRELSVVIPVMNEEDNIQPLLEAVHNALAELDYEIILVDDGSSDSTKKQVLKYADDRTIFVELRKNYGQSTAMTAGIDYAQGTYIAMIDGDLQNDPTDIPAMLNLLKEGDWDVVAGNRKNRQDGALLRKFPSRIANALIRRWTGVYIRDYGCTLKVFRREIAEDLGCMASCTVLFRYWLRSRAPALRRWM